MMNRRQRIKNHEHRRKGSRRCTSQVRKGINQSDTDAVMKLYASDGVFMPQNFPSSVGANAVRKAYDACSTPSS